MKYFNHFIGKKQDFFRFFIILVIGFWLTSCGWIVVGGGAYEGYKVGTDPRTIGTQIDDRIITSKVKLKLIEDPVTKARKIDVDTVNGVVTLTGLVDSEEERQRAIKIAASVEGVRKVINNLRIEKRTVVSYLSDKEITAKIKVKLIEDSELKALSIDVDTVNGVVTLTGMVESERQKFKAIEHAKSVSGVKKVIDNLQIKGKGY
ncbi:MAG: BON domain-containing protein [Thermodesulfobacteriaceae bacterium]|nr:BON domain-containing protein [Thermodesulfobacteriaceae bacterium]MCX8042142.1 BON domain-containing protein [Thermodesulfobacteriaceae bacterium]MDW8136321.1 BON domain-containing protein [Thermodesulfobacterium sp.]